jgi:hypothetical protein
MAPGGAPEGSGPVGLAVPTRRAKRPGAVTGLLRVLVAPTRSEFGPGARDGALSGRPGARSGRTGSRPSVTGAQDRKACTSGATWGPGERAGRLPHSPAAPGG